MKRYITRAFLSICMLSCSAFNTSATHLMGGSLSYVYLGDTDLDGSFNYLITFNTFINCNSIYWGTGFPEPDLEIGIYEGPANPTGPLNLTTDLTIPLVDTNRIELNLSDTCAVGNNVCIYEVKYEVEVDLDTSFVGYHLYYNRCCRNDYIQNLDVPGAEGMSMYAYIGPTLVNNSSPVFSDLPVPFLCAGDTQSIINTAFDLDGDQLIFSFVHPYKGDAGGSLGVDPGPQPTLSWPIPLVTYASGFNKNDPFGPAGSAYINGATGYSEYFSPDTGKYVVAVEIKEYRNNLLIGITRRDMQLQIIDCPANPPPNLSPLGGSGQTMYSIEEGDSICFPITFTDALGDSLIMEFVSPIFDTALTNPAATITTPVIGDSVVTSEFCWVTACGQGTNIPYLFTVSVRDNGCPPKTADDVYEIYVTPFSGPPAIIGNTSVCPYEGGVAYMVPNTPGATHDWIITGGTQISGGNTNSITVDWDSSGVGVVELVTTSSLGCSDDPISLNVTINPYPVTDAGQDVYFCSGDTVQLGAGATFSQTYAWSPAAGLDNPNLSNPLLSLANSGSTIDTIPYVLTAVNTLNSCENTDTVLAIVYPEPTANAGSNAEMCSEDTIAIGAVPIGGYTYSWVPTIGMLDSTLANPQITHTNIGTQPDTFTYVVTALDTAPNCYSSDTIVVIVNPYPIPDAGNDIVFCSGLGDSVGTTTTPGYTYSWSPSTGLSNSADPNPFLSLINTDTIVDTIGYVVGTTQFNCTAFDTVQVIVLPTPITDAGADVHICSGSSDTLGAENINGYDYLWSPSNGLSDTSISNPIVSLTNPVVITDTVLYNLLVTNVYNCVDSDEVVVTVNHLPISDAGNDTSFCSGDTASIGATAIVGYDYLWTPTNGLSDSLASNPNISLINTDTITDTLTYMVTTTVDSCSTTDTVTVIVYPLPYVDAGTDVYMCSGDTAQLGSMSISGYTYSWNPTLGLNDTTIADPLVSLTNPLIPNDTTEYIVLATSVFSCTDQDSVEVVVNHLPVSDAGNDTSFCSGDTASIGATAIVGYDYRWTPTQGLSDSLAAHPNISLINTDTITDTLTYIVTTTVDSCSTTDTVTVIVYPLPFVDAGLDTHVCSGLGIQIGSPAIGNYIYSWTPTNGLDDPSLSNPTVTWINNDSLPDTLRYEVEVTHTLTSCIQKDSMMVVVFPRPDSNLITGSISICPGADSISYGIDGKQGSSYQWILTGPGAIIAGQGQDSILINFDTANVWTIAVVETDSNGCISDTAYLYGKTNPLLEPPAPNGIDTLCTSNMTGISYQVPSTNGSVYSWDIIGGTITGGNGTHSITVDWDSAGAGELWYIESSTTFDTVCTGTSDTLPIFIYQSPTAVEIQGDTNLCESSLAEPYWVTGLSGSHFIWLLDGDTLISGTDLDSLTIVFDTAGIYELTVLETAIGNCTEILTDSITVNAKPQTIPISGDTAICYDSVGTYDYFTNGYLGSTYFWTVTGGSIGSVPIDNDSITVIWDSVGIGNLQVVESSAVGCIGDTISLNTNLFEIPFGTEIYGGSSFCEDTTGTVYSLDILPGSSIYWVVNGDTLSNGIDLDSLTLIWDTAGTYVLSTIELTTNGCSDTLSDTIIVYPKPNTSTIVGDTAICLITTDTFLYHVSGSPGSIYQWMIGNGSIAGGPSENDSIWVIWDGPGSGTIGTIEMNPDSCWGDTMSLNVSLFEIPSADSILGELSTCQYSDVFSYELNGFPSSTYIWSFPGATVISNDSSNTVTLVWDSAGTFSLQALEISQEGCIGDTIEAIVTINPFPQTQALSGDTIVCPPNHLNQLYVVDGLDSSTYHWTVMGGVIESGQGTDSLYVNWDSTGNGTVQVVEISMDSCWGDTVQWPLIVLDAPSTLLKVVTDGEFDDSEVEIKWEWTNYLGFPDSVSIMKRRNFSSNIWSEITRVPALDQSYIEVGVPTHLYSYDYIINGVNACKDSIGTSIHNTILLNGVHDEGAKTIDLTWNNYKDWEQGVLRYEVWRKLDDETDYSFYADAGQDTAIQFGSGKDGLIHCYRVLAHENGGYLERSWSNESCVEFAHLLHIPSVITPNANGLNDDWRIENIEFYPTCQVEIFNRWGMQVFSSTGYPVNWDGTYYGKDLPMGTYYYVIDIFKPGIKPYTGSVSILHRDD